MVQLLDNRMKKDDQMMTKQNALRMKKLFCSVLGSATIFAVASSASAVGLGGNANVGAGVSSGADTSAPAGATATVGGSAGMNAADSNHRGGEGNPNQNSQTSPNATRDMERAHERMNGMGSEHEQATDAKTRTKRSAKSHHKAKASVKMKGNADAK